MTQQLSHKTPGKVSSNRSFGLIMFAFFLILSVLPRLRGEHYNLWTLAISVVFLVPALIYPAILRLPNLWWMQFGELLSKIVSPVAIGLVYFVAITPIALLLKLFGKSTLSLGFDRKKTSYWITKETPQDPQAMRNQF